MWFSQSFIVFFVNSMLDVMGAMFSQWFYAMQGIIFLKY